jgi:hypothetical protein
VKTGVAPASRKKLKVAEGSFGVAIFLMTSKPSRSNRMQSLGAELTVDDG